MLPLEDKLLLKLSKEESCCCRTKYFYTLLDMSNGQTILDRTARVSGRGCSLERTPSSFQLTYITRLCVLAY